MAWTYLVYRSSIWQDHDIFELRYDVSLDQDRSN
jgi:hypothetical protein